MGTNIPKSAIKQRFLDFAPEHTVTFYDVLNKEVLADIDSNASCYFDLDLCIILAEATLDKIKPEPNEELGVIIFMTYYYLFKGSLVSACLQAHPTFTFNDAALDTKKVKPVELGENNYFGITKSQFDRNIDCFDFFIKLKSINDNLVGLLNFKSCSNNIVKPAIEFGKLVDTATPVSLEEYFADFVNNPLFNIDIALDKPEFASNKIVVPRERFAFSSNHFSLNEMATSKISKQLSTKYITFEEYRVFIPED